MSLLVRSLFVTYSTKRPSGDQLTGHFASRSTSSGYQAASVGHEDDVGGEDVEEALQVAVSDGSEEPVDDLLLLGRTDRHPRPPGGDVLAGPMGDLADGGG